VTYAALSGSGADNPLVLDAVEAIFPQIAAMKANRPTSRKIRAMPAWIRDCRKFWGQAAIAIGG